jgi:hypothetical protein
MSSELSDVVRGFYRAVADRDAKALDALVVESFSSDAAVEWPAGLPYGGRVEGRDTLRKIFGAMAGASAPIGPENLQLQAMLDGGDQIAAELAFDWRFGDAAIASGALELWTFEGGLVKEIRAYYWDTAACGALVRDAEAASA